MTDLQPITFPGIDPEKPLIIAGPCSAETPEQVMTTARQLAADGIHIFRAGIWKPRTKPGGFEGIGAPGLQWMQMVRQQTGMLTATEVANHTHARQAIEAGIDIIWIGARTSANPFAMQEIADTIAESAKASQLTVLVKNPVNPDIELWIGALQRIYNAGVRRLGAIHRGFTAYGPSPYRNTPHWHIPIELRLRYPNLPIIVDPSHIGGRRELIAPISQQALDMGFNGLIIESHCNPDCAWSDAAQQVTPQSLNLILNTLVVRDARQTTENLNLLRQQIDRIDCELLEIVARRMEVCRQIGLYKKEHAMTVVQADRYNAILDSRIQSAARMGLSAEFMKTLLLAIHDESVRQQIEIINTPSPDK